MMMDTARDAVRRGPMSLFQLGAVAICIGLNMLDGFDVLVMAFWTDTTRIATFQMGVEVTNKTLGIIGCGNISYSDLISPALSSIDQGVSSIGERAANLALSLLEEKTQKAPRSILVKPKLVIRASTRRS